MARTRRIDPRLIEWGLLFALIAAVTAIYAHFALRIGSYQPDEFYFMELAHFTAEHFPTGLWDEGIYFRGIQRVDQLVLAIPFAMLRGASIYQVAHVLQAFLFASAALPAWLLARSAGLGRLARALVAILTVVTPWAIVSTSFLTESAAYPAFAWVLYTTWRAARTPSFARELLALAALVLALFSRTAFIALAPIWPLAVLWQEWRWELREESWVGRVRRLPAQTWSRHRLLSIIVLLGVTAIVLSAAGVLPGGGVSALAGRYGLPQPGSVGGVLSRYHYYLSRVVVGTGFLGFVLALAWLARELIRPRDGNRHALAVIALLGVAVMLFSLIQGGPDERYLMYAAIPIALGFAAELDDRFGGRHVQGRPARLGLAVSLAAAVSAALLLITTIGWPPAQNEYSFFAYAAATFYRRVLEEKLGQLHVPLIHLALSDLVQPAVALVALAWIVAVCAKRVTRPAAWLMAAAVLVFCATEIGYTLHKFTRSPAATADGSDAAARSWLSTDVPRGAEIAAVGEGLSETAGYTPIWETTEFWNDEVQTGASFLPGGVPLVPLGGKPLLLTVDNASGRVGAVISGLAGSPPQPIPRYLLLPLQATNPYGFAAKRVAAAPYLPLELVRTEVPARLEWSLVGTSQEGFMEPGQPTIVTVYGGALKPPDRCLSFELNAPPAASGHAYPSWPYTVSSGGRVEARGTLAATKTRKFDVPLHPRARRGGKLATVTIRVHGQVKFVNGLTVSAKLIEVGVGACSSATS